MNTVWSSVKID